MNEMWVKRIWPYAAVMAVVAMCVVAFSNPLFAALGFEYSTLMALGLSFVSGIQASVWTGFQPSRVLERSTIFSFLWSTLLIATLPLLISFLSLIWIPNCSLCDGLVFYIEIAYPSAIFGAAFGVAFAMLAQKHRWAVGLFTSFWIITLVLSLLPGYMNPQLFTYGWQYGFFPGFVWDESLDLSNAYLFSRAENVLWALLLLTIAYEWRGAKPIRGRFFRSGALALLVVLLFGMHDVLHITVSHDAVLEQLSKEEKVTENCWFHCAPHSLTDEEVVHIREDVQWYLHDVRRRFELRDAREPVNIYIYPSSESLNQHLGTRVASIAKPWLGEVHIAKGNLQSLKHELTHVLLREKGSFPFYASWSTGLTEGAAMSVEPVYDGIYTLDEHAARILQLKYATGIKDIMSFSGFAANASTKSYVLAGSFSRFLLSTYGARPFNQVYSSLNFKEAYGKPLDTLEAEWKVWLAPLMTPLDAGDSAHFRYYYDRASILFTPCVRRIGKLERRASEAFNAKQYDDAVTLYSTAVNEGGGISPLFGEVTALLQQDRIQAAIAVLDTTRSPTIKKQAVVAALQRADLKVINNEPGGRLLYDTAMAVKLSAKTFLAAYIHSALRISDIDSSWRYFLRHEYLPHRDTFSLVALLDSMRVQHWENSEANWWAGPVTVDYLLRYLQSAQLLSIGQIDSALSKSPLVVGFPFGLVPGDAADSLAVSVIALHYARLRQGPTYEWCCPLRYRHAATEQAREITAEWNWLAEESLRPGRKRSP